jgi:hypothetical protein
MAMNTAYLQMMQDDLAAPMADWSEVFVHAFTGQQINGSFSPITTARDVDPEGILNEADAEHVSSKSLWTTPPALGDTGTINGKHFYIMDMTDDPAAYTLQLKAVENAD